ncbi:hypothetical protein [Rhodococcus daqingensis]|uniref:Uncharacterized protein n=1 Tax=Rhodococcus daqingensis TaxID=2479363 RepID=A0ABW2S4Y6_9NOCA
MASSTLILFNASRPQWFPGVAKSTPLPWVGAEGSLADVRR